jgi:signal peptidase II
LTDTQKDNSAGTSKSDALGSVEKACWAIWCRPAICLFAIVVIFGVAADLLSKHVVFENLLAGTELESRVQNESQRLQVAQNLGNEKIPDANSPEFTRLVLMRLKIYRDIFPGLRFMISTNPGIVFGFDAIPDFFVSAATVVMIIVVLIFFATSHRNAYWVQVGFALIMAGALGNLYDRLCSSVVLPGLSPITHHVRDFIDCSDLGYPYIFNVADAWLVIGVAMIILWYLREWRKEHKQQKTATGQ